MTIKVYEGALPVSTNVEQGYLQMATAHNTRRAYQGAIRQFQAAGGLLPASETDIANYLTQKAIELNPRTLSLHLTALSHWHQYQDLPDPTQSARIRKLLTGIYRSHGKPKRKAKALQPEHIVKLIEACQTQAALRAARDSALIQIAYFGAFRRSELVNIRMGDLEFTQDGMIVTIPRSKTDTLGQGKTKALPIGNERICPVRATRDWLALSGIREGALFRGINRWDELQSQALHADSVNTILKSLAHQCKFEFVATLSSHSLRRGFATSAARAGAEFSTIKRQGGWQNDQTVRGYIEEGELFDENAADHLIKKLF